MSEFQPHIFIPILAGAITVFGMLLGAACVFSVDAPRVRRARR